MCLRQSQHRRGFALGPAYLHAALVERRQDAALVQSCVSEAFQEKKGDNIEGLHLRSGADKLKLEVSLSCKDSAADSRGNKGLIFELGINETQRKPHNNYI